MNLRTAAALGGLIVLTLFGCKPAEVALPQTEPLPVATISVHAADEPRWIEMLGQAEGGGEVEVRAQVSGILKRFNYQEGDLVKAGDVLFEIEDAPFKARLDAARSTRLQYADELAQAERELKRTSTLYKSGAASRKDYDDAVSTRNQKKFQFEQAAADEKDAAISLNWTKVLAPASGFASARISIQAVSLMPALRFWQQLPSTTTFASPSRPPTVISARPRFLSTVPFGFLQKTDVNCRPSSTTFRSRLIPRSAPGLCGLRSNQTSPSSLGNSSPSA